MAVNEILGALKDKGILRDLGREIGAGMAGAGGGSVLGPENVTGRAAAGERASSDPSIKAQKDYIRQQQLQTKYAHQVSKSFQMLNKELVKGEKDARKVVTATTAFSKAFNSQWSHVMDAVSDSKRVENNLIKNLNANLEQEITTIEDVLAIRKRHEQLEKKILDAKTARNKKDIAEYNKLSQALGKSTHGIESWSDSLANTGKRFVRGFFSVEAALANLSIAVKQLTNDFRSQLKFGSQLGVWGNQMKAMSMGMDPEAFTAINAEARQASLTFGSLGEYTDDLRTQQLRYFNQIGDLTEATRFTAQTFQLLGKSGVRPNIQAMDSMASSFRVLNKIAGVTSDQFNVMMDNVLADEDIQKKLRGVRASERQALIAGIAKQIEMNTAMGMTVEQATEAARAMGKLGGGTAKERFKQAAMTQATFGAMGIAGGAEAADLIRKGARRSAEDNARLQELMGKVSNEAAEARVGGYGAEMMVDTMMDKSGMGQYLGPNSPFNTNLTNGLAANKGVLEQIRDGITDQMGLGEKALVVADTISNFIINGALGKMLTGVAQLIGAYIIGKGLLGGGAGLGRAALGAGTALRTAGTAIGAGATAAAPALAVAAAGAAGYAAGTVLYDKVLDDNETFMTGADKFFGGIDRVLGFFGNDDAQARNEIADANEEQARIQAEMARTGLSQKELAEQQLAEAKKSNDLQALTLEMAQGQLTQTQYNNRMSRIMNGQGPQLGN